MPPFPDKAVILKGKEQWRDDKDYAFKDHG